MAPSRSPFQELQALYEELASQKKAEEQAKQRATRERRQIEAEKNLFLEQVKDVIPLPASNRFVAQVQPIAPLARQRSLDEARALAESLSDEFDAESLIDTDDLLAWHRAGLGPDVVRRLRRGAWVIQDHLDLHGARRNEARELVSEFVRTCVKRGLRCVRIVHGKGLGSLDKQPVLKGHVRRWLTQKDEVLAFCQAKGQDGGSGALIVLLRPSKAD